MPSEYKQIFMKYAITAKNIKLRHEIYRMGGTVEIIKSAYSDAWNLLKKSWKNLLIDIVKIELVVFLLSLINGAILIFGITSFMGEASNIYELLQNIPVWYYAIAIPVYIAVTLLTAVVGSLLYNIIDNRAKGKITNFTEQFSMNIVPVITYTVLWGVFVAVTMLPMLGIAGGGIGALALMCIYPLALAIINTLVLFFLQFAYFEIIVGRRSVIDGFKTSISLVNKTAFTTFVFDILFFIVAIIVSIPFYGVYIVFLWVGELAALAIGDALTGGLISNFVSSIGMIILQTAGILVLLPVFYFFWKKIRE